MSQQIEEEMATVKVFRFNPERDTEPRFETYKTPYEGRTVLDVLKYIRENHDPTLAFRESCRTGLCGICGIMVNGKACEACLAPAKKEMTIEPPRALRFKVLRDLISIETMVLQRDIDSMPRHEALDTFTKAYEKHVFRPEPV